MKLQEQLAALEERVGFLEGRRRAIYGHVSEGEAALAPAQNALGQVEDAFLLGTNDETELEAARAAVDVARAGLQKAKRDFEYFGWLQQRCAALRAELRLARDGELQAALVAAQASGDPAQVTAASRALMSHRGVRGNDYSGAAGEMIPVFGR